VLALRTVTYCTENEETPIFNAETLNYSLFMDAALLTALQNGDGDQYHSEMLRFRSELKSFEGSQLGRNKLVQAFPDGTVLRLSSDT
jgi:hypothetical protein